MNNVPCHWSMADLFVSLTNHHAMKKQKEESAIVITKHAFKRAKQRLSFKANALKKMALKAYQQGISFAEMKDLLHKFVDRMWLVEHSTYNIRIYGEVFYFFADNTLITLYQMPRSLRKWTKMYIHRI